MRAAGLPDLYTLACYKVPGERDGGGQSTMPEFIHNAGRDLPFILLLIAVLGFRWRVTPRVSIFIAAGAAIVIAGWIAQNTLMVIFGGLAIAVNIRLRTIDSGLVPLSSLQVMISAFGFMSMMAAYAVLFRYLVANIPLVT